MQREGVSPAPRWISESGTGWYGPGVGWVRSVRTVEGSEMAVESTFYAIR